MTGYATERPLLTAFLLSQICISGPPIALFLITTLLVAISAMSTGILLGLLGAVFFICTFVGVSLVLLVPILFFTVMAGMFLWFWGVVIWCVITWFNRQEMSDVQSYRTQRQTTADSRNQVLGKEHGAQLIDKTAVNGWDKMWDDAARTGRNVTSAPGQDEQTGGPQPQPRRNDPVVTSSPWDATQQRKSAMKRPDTSSPNASGISRPANGSTSTDNEATTDLKREPV